LEIKQRIIHSYQELAAARGFHNITVDEIAEHSGISKRTMYRRFKSKDEILEAAVDDFLADVACKADELLNSEQDISIIIKNMINYLVSSSKSIINQQVLEDLSKYYPHLWHKIDDFRMQRIQLMLAAAKSQSCENMDINPVVLSTIILASVQAVINPDFILKNNLTFEEVTRQLVTIFMPLLSSSAREP